MMTFWRNSESLWFLLRMKCKFMIFISLDLLLGGDYMIPVSRDEILSRFAGIPAML